MLTGIVKKAYARHKKPICIGRGGKNYLQEALWPEVFENNPKIAQEPYPGCVWVPDIKGNRPYIDYAATEKRKDQSVVYKRGFRPEPGELFFTDEELAPYQHLDGFIYIEPNVKGSFSGNKDWGFDKWQQVVERLPFKFIQGRGRKLDGVIQIGTPSFRSACALLSKSRLFVGTDGGLHHAAAALQIPAVVIWGGLVGPDTLGYDNHVNIRAPGVRDCGSHTRCEHCRRALDRITVDQVCEAIANAYPADRGDEARLPEEQVRSSA
jgi:hypothetical protein